MIRTKKILSIVLILTLAVFSGCEKDFDVVPVKELPEGNIITIDSLRNIYTAFDTTIVSDISIYGVVTADAVSGNIYKELYIQDETNAIKLELLSSADFFIGDRVRVAIKGATIRRDRNMLVLDNINPDIAIIKQEGNQDLTPEVVTIEQLIDIDVWASKYQGKLVQINNVEFKCSDQGNTWSDAIGQRDEDRTLIDAIGDTVIVRSSGFSAFAGEQLPFGNGSIIGVVSQYVDKIQLTIRNPNEFNMQGTRASPCPTFIYNKDFQDTSITSGGWTTQQVLGSFNWTTSDQGSSDDFYAVISNFSGGNTASEAWLISPSFDFTTFSSVSFSFENAFNFSGPDLEVYVSTDYDGVSLPTTATWTPLQFVLSSGGFDFVPSENINLTPFISLKTYVAFKYTGTNTSGSTWEIDKIKIEAL